MCSKRGTKMFLAILLIYIASVRSNDLNTNNSTGFNISTGLNTTLVDSEELKSICTTCIKVKETCHNVSYLFEIDAPFRNTVVITKLGVMKTTNILYFSFEPAIEDKEYYKTGFINLEDPFNKSVISVGKQITNFGTFDIDQANEFVYLGGSDGMYILDTKSGRVVPYSSHGDTVMSLFFKGNIYFIRYGEYKIVRKKGDTFDMLFETVPVKMFVINKYNVIVFLSFYGLFAKRGDEVMRLSKNAFFRGIVMDHYEKIYVWWIDSIYEVIIEPILTESRIVKVAHIPSIGALTFDKDNNFLFTAGRSLYRLIETTEKFC